MIKYPAYPIFLYRKGDALGHMSRVGPTTDTKTPDPKQG